MIGSQQSWALSYPVTSTSTPSGSQDGAQCPSNLGPPQSPGQVLPCLLAPAYLMPTRQRHLRCPRVPGFAVPRGMKPCSSPSTCVRGTHRMWSFPGLDCRVEQPKETRQQHSAVPRDKQWMHTVPDFVAEVYMWCSPEKSLPGCCGPGLRGLRGHRPYTERTYVCEESNMSKQNA